MRWSGETMPIAIGDEVFGSEGAKVGAVADVRDGYIVVEKGFFFPADYAIPHAAIAQAGDGTVILNVSRETALTSDWPTVPEAPAATGIMTGDHGWDLASEVTAVERSLAQDVGSPTAGTPHHAAAATNTDEIAAEEPLRVRRRIVDRPDPATGAEVREEIVIEVPLTAEQVARRKEARRYSGVRNR